MINLVGRSPSLRKLSWVAMASMHFHIAKTGLFMGIFFSFRGPREHFGANSKLSLCAW